MWLKHWNKFNLYIYAVWPFLLRSFSVALIYRNDSTVTEPYYLTLPGCARLCPLQDFIRLTNSVIPADWHKECQISSSTSDKGINKNKPHKL